MTQFWKLVVSLVVVVALAGCLQVAGVEEAGGNGGLPTDAGEPGAVSAPGPEEYPPRPATLTNDSVGRYVAEYEEVYREIYIIRNAEVDVTEVGVQCEPTAVSESAGVYTVTVSCGSWYEFEDGDDVGIADGAGYTAVYEVTGDGIERLDDQSTAP